MLSNVCRLLAVSLLLCSTTGEAPAGTAPSLQELFERSGIPGMSVACVRDGELAEVLHLGVRSTATGSAVDDSTVFEAASLTKPVVAYTTLRLAARGVIDLDAPLWQLVEYERLVGDPLAPLITARMVLSHTSGLPNWGGTPLERNFEPGAGWGYSGEGYVFLAEALEARTGERLEDLVRRECFEPLGMVHSSLLWREEYARLAAVGHDLIGDPVEKYRPTDENAAASLHTTAIDYARFLAAVLDGRGLDPGLHAQMLAPVGEVQGWGSEEAASHLRWGLGWGLQPGADGPAVWHWGDNGAFRCFVFGRPSTRDGVVYFTNSQHGLSIAEDLLALETDDPAWSVRWLGYARYDDPREQARIAVRRAFAKEGDTAGWKVLETYEASTGEPVSDDELLGLADFLSGRGQSERAVSVLARIVDERPSAQVLRALGLAQTQTGAHDEALAHLQRAAAMDSSLVDELTPRIAWLHEGVRAEGNEPPLDRDALARLAGPYGPRRVALDGADLFYAREGATKRTRLFPLFGTTFALEDNHAFRLRIETDGSGDGVAAVGLYADGRTDRTERNPTVARPDCRTKLPDFQMEDQFRAEHARAEFDDRVAIFVWADRKGSEFVDRWKELLRAGLSGELDADRVRLRSVAHVKGAPFFVKGRIRDSFSKQREEWLLLDWKGVFAKTFDPDADAVTVFVFDQQGCVRARESGTEVDAQKIARLIEAAQEASTGAAEPRTEGR